VDVHGMRNPPAYVRCSFFATGFCARGCNRIPHTY
jgi:hypothetical protein